MITERCLCALCDRGIGYPLFDECYCHSTLFMATIVNPHARTCRTCKQDSLYHEGRIPECDRFILRPGKEKSKLWRELFILLKSNAAYVEQSNQLLAAIRGPQSIRSIPGVGHARNELCTLSNMADCCAKQLTHVVILIESCGQGETAWIGTYDDMRDKFDELFVARRLETDDKTGRSYAWSQDGTQVYLAKISST